MLGFGVKFKTQQSRFLDRPIYDKLNKTKRSYLMRSGGAIRKTARRSLRKAPQVKLSELTERQRQRYEIKLREFREGRLREKPRRPERIAERGRPPLLHMKPESPLKEMLFFFMDEKQESVLIGPSQFRGGNLQQLEATFPFMEPALKAIEPKFPEYLAAASR